LGTPEKKVFDPKLLLANVGAGKEIFKFRKNKYAFEQGDVADTVFYIQQGKVNLAVLSDPIPERGEFFCKGCLNSQRLRSATTTAMENCLITLITKPAMIAALHNEPKFPELFMAATTDRSRFMVRC
jgi:CRP/FNR family transcriptional regulator, cyclic AMP receptor protein